MKTLAMLIAAAGLALSLGCSQEKSESPAAEPEAAAQAQANGEAAAPASDVEIADGDLPVAADFEEEADSEITGDNYASILDELEAEIASE